ncbi:MAG: ferrous iron transport protein B, partial [Thermoguttaceae bacterium]
HRVWGTLIFILFMLVMFRSVFTWAVPAMELIETATGALGETLGATLADGPLKSLVVDGVIAGVGSVLVFLPQIFILFFFIALLEDCGYMARAAYLMDRLMVRAGLSGKSFIPLLSSFACAIPGVMATRVIENRRDRFTTIMVAPLMSCSARLPVYTVLIAAFIPTTTYAGGLFSLQGLTMFAMYAVGIATAVVVAMLLKKTILRGDAPAFVMELPSYKFPSLRLVFQRMLERGWAFVRRAGTLIFAVSVIVWAAAYYPRDAATVEAPFRDSLDAVAAQIEAVADDPSQTDRLAELTLERSRLQGQIAGAYQRQSYLGRAGQAIEPLVRPLGWDWRIGCAAIASFPAREVVVSTLGVIYNLGGDQDEASLALRERLKEATWDDTGEKVYNVPVALSIMVFFALCAQCAATLAVIRRETNSWRWPIFTFTYMTTLAYLGALATYQIGMLFVG